jgi:hypothetical protein
MYEDLTDIHVRYRVTKIRVRATFHNAEGSMLMCSVYPYRSISTGLTKVAAIQQTTGSVVKAVSAFSPPV